MFPKKSRSEAKGNQALGLGSIESGRLDRRQKFSLAHHLVLYATEYLGFVIMTLKTPFKDTDMVFKT